MRLFELIPFKREHTDHMLNQEINASLKEYWGSELASWVEGKNSFTGMVAGRPVVCGGILPYWPGRGQLWTIFDENCGGNFLPVFRGIKRYLTEQQKVWRRIEISVPCDFEKGRRRAEMLGFRLECPYAEGYEVNGADAALYTLIRKGG